VPHRALNWLLTHDTIALSPDVEDEYFDVLHRPKLARFLDPELRAEVLGLLLTFPRRFTPTVRVRDCRDAKDDKYLELALAAGATLIVSSDNDLLILSPWRGIPILRPAEYLAQAASRDR